MDAVVVSLTFGLGYGAHRFGLPPLVGFLLAGFGLHSLGYANTPILSSVADTGVTLLLFTIGLKLKIKNLFKPEVWAGATIHLALTFASFGFILFILTHTGLQFFLDLPFRTALLLGFALSFSSTVFAVKILEESGRMNALNGRTAIGVLIIQDVIAVVYLTFSKGKIPSLWAIALIISLPVARWLFFKIMDKIGHGELQVIFGLFLALVAGAAAFDAVSLKADLGALILGMLIGAPTQKQRKWPTPFSTLKTCFLSVFSFRLAFQDYRICRE